jgi:DNA replication licensing factor MCM2
VAQRRRIPAAMMQDTEESMLSEGNEMTAEMRKRRERHFQDLGDDEDQEDAMEDEKFLDLEEMRGKLNLWIRDPRTIRYIRRTFKNFLLKYRDEQSKSLVYEGRINDMCSANQQSLEITYIHLTQMNPTLAYWIFETPALILPYLNQVAFEIACKYFPGYENIHNEIYIKIKEFPLEEKLRDLRTFHLNTLVKVRGVVTRRYPVYSQLKKIWYLCRCGNRMGPIYQNADSEIKLGQCPNCHSNGPFTMDQEMAVYRNYQKITVQESPGSVLPGRVPRYKDTVLLGDNIDIARPGDEVEIVGIYTNKFDWLMNVKHGFPVFSTIIEANYVRRISEMELTDLSQQDKDEILRISKKSNLKRIIINSIAPSIYGHHHIKTALSLSMFGGQAKNYQDSHKIRGDINVLLLGDPGLAKSQFLKYVEQTFPRTVYTTGKGASACGLTASVRRDPTSQEWTLEGGALVLADSGMCLIDEFDKMNESDRTSIHEAMEQQTISISKAGIVATLQARCAVIAAANPVKGRYDSQLVTKYFNFINANRALLTM